MSLSFLRKFSEPGAGIREQDVKVVGTAVATEKLYQRRISNMEWYLDVDPLD
ncbi:hypothetical protein [Sellimonas catena]|uniref:hypothetical protein n=1 Tax=Sellimonas catena TaxID=2994035 RepID=UPI00386A9DA4